MCLYGQDCVQKSVCDLIDVYLKRIIDVYVNLAKSLKVSVFLV